MADRAQCLADGLVAYHRNDIGSVIIRICVGMATNAVDLFDVVHVCTRRMLPSSLEVRAQLFIESCYKPKSLVSLSYEALRPDEAAFSMTRRWNLFLFAHVVFSDCRRVKQTNQLRKPKLRGTALGPARVGQHVAIRWREQVAPSGARTPRPQPGAGWPGRRQLLHTPRSGRGNLQSPPSPTGLNTKNDQAAPGGLKAQRQDSSAAQPGSSWNLEGFSCSPATSVAASAVSNAW